MNCAWSMIVVVLYLVLFHFTNSLSLRAIEKRDTIVVTANMLPMMNSLTPINSSAIQLIWSPSPAIQGINLTQLPGIFTIGLYAGAQTFTGSTISIFPITSLNQSGQMILNSLQADTVYYSCFQSQWFPNNVTIDGFALNGTYRRGCQLLRTYMQNQTILNPVPPFGQYTWTQVQKPAGTVSIVVNASISSQLPYQTRNITVMLGSNNQSQTFNIPSESVAFEFDGFASAPQTYPLSITFMLVDNTVDHRFMPTNTVNGIVNITATNMGNKQFFPHSLLFIILITFILF